MQEIFNLVSVRQMYAQEGKTELASKFDKLISIVLDQLTAPKDEQVKVAPKDETQTGGIREINT